MTTRTIGLSVGIASLFVLAIFALRPDVVDFLGSGTSNSGSSRNSDLQDGSSFQHLNEAGAESRPDTIHLPNGEPIQIVWRYERPMDFPPPPFVHQYEMLRASAENGDGESALILHGIMQMCQSAFETKDQLESAIDQLQQTHTLKLPDMNSPANLGDPEQVPFFIEQMRTQYQNCTGLGEERRSDSTQWLKMAAERQVPIAMIEFGGQTEDPREALDWFKGAWEAGEPEGLIAMADVYWSNFDSGQPGDNVNAYAAQLAYTTLVDAGMGGANHGPIAHSQVRRVKDMLEHAKGRLREYELDEATILASELITSNPNCCLGM